MPAMMRRHGRTAEAGAVGGAAMSRVATETHSSQMCTLGPATSFKTSAALFLQNEQRSWNSFGISEPPRDRSGNVRLGALCASSGRKSAQYGCSWYSHGVKARGPRREIAVSHAPILLSASLAAMLMSYGNPSRPRMEDAPRRTTAHHEESQLGFETQSSAIGPDEQFHR